MYGQDDMIINWWTFTELDRTKIWHGTKVVDWRQVMVILLLLIKVPSQKLPRQNLLDSFALGQTWSDSVRF